MKKRPTVVESVAPRQASLVDVLEAMLSTPATKALMAQPGVKVVQSFDSRTGRLTYSFRAEDEFPASEDTPSQL